MIVFSFGGIQNFCDSLRLLYLVKSGDSAFALNNSKQIPRSTLKQEFQFGIHIIVGNKGYYVEHTFLILKIYK